MSGIFGIPVVVCFFSCLLRVQYSYMNCYIQYLFILSFPSFPLPCIQQQQQEEEEEGEEKEEEEEEEKEEEKGGGEGGRTFLISSAALRFLPPPSVSCPNIV